jgi:preprotein translocase subunit SecB
MSTVTPPIQLIMHFFTNVHIDANTIDIADFNVIQKREPIEYDINSEISARKMVQDNKGLFQATEEDTGLFQITLKIVISEKENSSSAYKVSITTVGLVKVNPNVPVEKHLGHAIIYGASLLYGAVREYLYTLTLRGPLPPIYLPTTSFIPQENETIANNDK